MEWVGLHFLRQVKAAPGAYANVQIENLLTLCEDEILMHRERWAKQDKEESMEQQTEITEVATEEMENGFFQMEREMKAWNRGYIGGVSAVEPQGHPDRYPEREELHEIGRNYVLSDEVLRKARYALVDARIREQVESIDNTNHGRG